MINKEKIHSIVNELIEDTDLFLVEIKVSSSNKIDVYVDGKNGITIKQCVEISRAIEGSLDRDTEDFDLQVSSPGIDSAFKVKEQYIKSIGKNVEVLLKDGTKLQGILKEYTEEKNIVLETEKRIKLEGKKKKELVKEVKEISLNDLKQINVLLSFK